MCRSTFYAIISIKARYFAALLLAGQLSVPSVAADLPYSPKAGRDYPTQVFWGDTHLHSSLSTDAAAYGDTLGPDKAYRFALGQEVVSSSGQKVALNKPLDFLVVADHSDGLGFFKLLKQGHPSIVKEEQGQRWHEMVKEGRYHDVARALISSFSQGKLPWKTNDPSLLKPVWHQIVDTAERYNDPGQFTAFIGYEWTSLIAGNNLHRVVMYRDGADKTRDFMPYTLADSADPEDLWANMAQYESETGGSVFAIPHNGNLSNGMMFADKTIDGQPYTADYLKRRKRWEPLYEVTQIKGDGETHPLLSPEDEFADYGTWDEGNLDLSAAKTDGMLQYEYARAALKRGVGYQGKQGLNPFEFGMIGSTDSHTSLAGAEEDNFFGKHPGVEPSNKRPSKTIKKTAVGSMQAWQYMASGYAAVWATENSRAAIWDAMKRRETYATTGSRMQVRFFAAWDFKETDLQQPIADIGYAKGVPMGAVLTQKAGERRTPTFLVSALKDPARGNLDRIQIVKGWHDSQGQLQERVYNVVWAGARSENSKGQLAAVGNSVNVETATWQNNIGASSLTAVWVDPDYESDQQAFYYARVLEIPTPRWSTYDAARLSAPVPEDAPKTTQERAYTSPIWVY